VFSGKQAAVVVKVGNRREHSIYDVCSLDNEKTNPAMRLLCSCTAVP